MALAMLKPARLTKARFHAFFPVLMSKKTRTELEILISAYETKASTENAAKLIATLREALEASEKDRHALERDIRKLEVFLSENACAQRKSV